MSTKPIACLLRWKATRRSGFLNVSACMCSVGQYESHIVTCMKLSFRKCLWIERFFTFRTPPWAQCRTVWLSSSNSVGHVCSMPSSFNRDQSHTTSLVSLLEEIYSASAEDMEMNFFLLDFHDTGDDPILHNIPDVAFLSLESPAQSASAYTVIFPIPACMWTPCVAVPFKYLRTRLAATISECMGD